MAYKNSHIFTDEMLRSIIKTVFNDERCYCDKFHPSGDDGCVEAKVIGYTSSMLSNGMEYPVEIYIYENAFDITIFHDCDYMRSDDVNIDELRGRLTSMMQVAAPGFECTSTSEDSCNFMMTFTYFDESKGE